MLLALLQTPELGDDELFRAVDYTEQYAEIPETVLVRIETADQIPVENAPKAGAGALAEFFAADANGGYR